MEDDWREKLLETLEFLRGQSFIWKPYKAYRPGWEHDHCAACAATLVEAGVDGEDVIHEGYATTASYKLGEDYEWVCNECFQEFGDAMEWQDATRGR